MAWLDATLAVRDSLGDQDAARRRRVVVREVALRDPDRKALSARQQCKAHLRLHQRTEQGAQRIAEVARELHEQFGVQTLIWPRVLERQLELPAHAAAVELRVVRMIAVTRLSAARLPAARNASVRK